MPVPPTCCDVLVVGAGPAGRSIADHCGRRGLHTVLVAAAPHAPWRATYGLWLDQTDALPAGSAWVRAATVWAGERRLTRPYVILDNTAAQGAYSSGPVQVRTGAVTGAVHRRESVTVRLRSGERIRSRLVIDASGQRRVLSGGPPRGPRVEQTAAGVILPQSAARAVVEPGDAVFMRWDRRSDGAPTFLYAVPLTGDRVLLEETSLARRPGLPRTELERRLRERLGRAGVPLGAALGTEQVRFAMDLPPARPARGVVPFGVAAGMMHPATGYSVGETLAAAPGLAAAIADALPRGPDEVCRAARAHLWSARARAVHRLRAWGRHTLLNLPPERVPEFFDAFFAVPEVLQHAYLCGRDDLLGTAGAMLTTARRVPGGLRAEMAAAGLTRR